MAVLSVEPEMTTAPSVCPKCHLAVKPEDYFCPNCGANLRSKPPGTSLMSQFLLYLGSAVLPPMGIIWGIKYLRRPDDKSKMIGVVAILITVVVLVAGYLTVMDVLKQVDSQVNSGLQNVRGF